jgi:hypothetical protein
MNRRMIPIFCVVEFKAIIENLQYQFNDFWLSLEKESDFGQCKVL